MKARVPKGALGGSPQNMTSMIKQAQKMQNEITTLQSEIEQREFNATSGGGAVEIVMLGNKSVKSIKIKPEVVNPDEIDMLEDLIISAFNQGVSLIEETTEDEMSKVTGGVSLPGLF